MMFNQALLLAVFAEIPVFLSDCSLYEWKAGEHRYVVSCKISGSSVGVA